MSTAILKLTESGEIQKIHKKWFCNSGCPEEQGMKSKASRLHLSNFWALYSLCGIFALTAFFLFLIGAVRQYIRYKNRQTDPSSPTFSASSNVLVPQSIHNFFKFIDKNEEAIKRYFSQHNVPPTQEIEAEIELKK